ncbi:MAG: hypothetical protein ACJ76S_06175 [Solirubrobacteraceae bacterium]|jgi:hypothetical protein
MSARRPPAWMLLAAGVALGPGGCGGKGPGTTGASAPARPSTTAAPPRAGKARVRPPRRRHATPVAGGERPVRARATFTLRGGRLVPRIVSVPPFLAVRVSAAAADRRTHVVTIAADRVYRLTVPPGGRSAVVLPGQRPGRYAVRAGAARATLAVGGEPGG